MIKKSVVLTVLLVLASVGHLGAACTAEEVQSKAQAFQQAAMAAAQKDPQKYQEAMTAMQKEVPALQNSNNLDAICAFYDTWTAKLR